MQGIEPMTYEIPRPMNQQPLNAIHPLEAHYDLIVD